jgi:capsule polysaccharide export protein KpsE/RkpR
MGGSGADTARIAAVLQSTAVTDAVIDRFDLKTRYGGAAQELLREELWSHCDVKTIARANLVQLSCEDKDPRFLQPLLTFFTEHGNEVFRRVNVSSASEEVRFGEKRVAELRRQADEVAARMREFQETHRIVDLDSQAKAVVSSVAMLNSQRIAKRMELEYAKGFTSPDEAGARQLESQLSVVDEQLRDLEEPRAPTPASKAGGGSSKGKGPGMFPATLEVPKLRSEYEKLYRDRRVAEATLVFALDRLESARSNEARDVSTFQVLDPPTLPTKRSRPRISLSVIFSALAGLAVGVLLEGWRSRRSA